MGLQVYNLVVAESMRYNLLLDEMTNKSLSNACHERVEEIFAACEPHSSKCDSEISLSFLGWRHYDHALNQVIRTA